MTAGQDLIFFDSPEDWEIVLDRTFNAVIVGENSYIPIPPQNLGLSLVEPYIAVIVTVSSKKKSWYFAGDIRQVYNFAPGSGNNKLDIVQTERTRLAIDKLQVIDTGRIGPDNYDLSYHPPYWFKSCAIRVYKYTGDVLNFVEDSLFSIGNALGVDPNNPNGKLVLALAAIKDLINQRYDDLVARIDRLDGGTGGTGGTGGSGSGGGSGGGSGTPLGFSTSGGGTFEPSSSGDSSVFGYTQGFL